MLTSFFLRFLQPSRMAAAWGWPSVVPLWSRMAAGCGPPQTAEQVQPFTSHCRHAVMPSRSNLHLCRNTHGISSVYAQAVTEKERNAQTKVFEIVVASQRAASRVKRQKQEVHGEFSAVVRLPCDLCTKLCTRCFCGRRGKSLKSFGVPGGIRTRVTAVKGRCPRPG